MFHTLSSIIVLLASRYRNHSRAAFYSNNYSAYVVTSTELSISINVFWGSERFMAKLRNIDGVKAAFHLWLVNVLEQNRSVPSFSRILEE